MRKWEKNEEKLIEEKQQCIKALLNRPWVLKEEDPETFQQIKDHYEALRDWFHDYLGYPLLVTRQFAKVEKFPETYHSWMGIDEFKQSRDYALFTYCLWYLEGRGDGEQFLLSQMVEDIHDHLQTYDVLIDWTLYEHRLSMARALRKCRDLKVLLSVDGEEGAWARDEKANVLYECSPMARYVLRRFSKELMHYSRIGDFHAELDEKDEKVKRRQRVYRRLVQEPVVYDSDWSEDERQYVLTQRRSLIDQLQTQLGLEGRRYREALIFFDPGLSAEHELFPTLSSVSDLLILTASELRKRIAKGYYEQKDDGRIMMSVTDLESLLFYLRDKHKEFWSKEHRVASSKELLKQVVSHLEEWNLGELDEQEVTIYPALSRWIGEYDSFAGGDMS